MTELIDVSEASKTIEAERAHLALAAGSDSIDDDIADRLMAIQRFLKRAIWDIEFNVLPPIKKAAASEIRVLVYQVSQLVFVELGVTEYNAAARPVSSQVEGKVNRQGAVKLLGRLNTYEDIAAHYESTEQTRLLRRADEATPETLKVSGISEEIKDQSLKFLRSIEEAVGQAALGT